MVRRLGRKKKMVKTPRVFEAGEYSMGSLNGRY